MALIKCRECANEVSSKAETCPKCGAKVKKKGIGILGGIGILFVIGVVGSMVVPKSGSTAATGAANGAADPVAKSPKETALAAVQLANLTWHKGGFDGIMILNTILQNNGDRGVKDIEVTCEHYSNSGTKIDRNVKTIYESVPPKKSVKVKEFSMGFIHTQAQKTNCEITDLVLL